METSGDIGKTIHRTLEISYDVYEKGFGELNGSPIWIDRESEEHHPDGIIRSSNLMIVLNHPNFLFDLNHPNFLKCLTLGSLAGSNTSFIVYEGFSESLKEFMIREPELVRNFEVPVANDAAGNVHKLTYRSISRFYRQFMKGAIDFLLYLHQKEMSLLELDLDRNFVVKDSTVKLRCLRLTKITTPISKKNDFKLLAGVFRVVFAGQILPHDFEHLLTCMDNYDHKYDKVLLENHLAVLTSSSRVDMIKHLYEKFTQLDSSQRDTYNDVFSTMGDGYEETAELDGTTMGDGSYEGTAELDGTTMGGGSYEGTAELDGTTMGGGTYEGTAELDGTTMGGGSYEGTAELDGTTMGGGTYEGTAELDGTTMGGGTYEGTAELDGTTMGGGSYEGTAELDGTTMGGGTYEGTAELDGTTMGGGSYEGTAELDGTTMGDESYEGTAELDSTTMRDGYDWTAKLDGTHPEYGIIEAVFKSGKTEYRIDKTDDGKPTLKSLNAMAIKLSRNIAEHINTDDETMDKYKKNGQPFNDHTIECIIMAAFSKQLVDFQREAHKKEVLKLLII